MKIGTKDVIQIALTNLIKIFKIPHVNNTMLNMHKTYPIENELYPIYEIDREPEIAQLNM